MKGDLAITFDKYLSEDEEHEVDEYLPEMLLYRGVGDRIVNVDAPRVPLSEVPVPSATVTQEPAETLVPTVVTSDQISNEVPSLLPPEDPPPAVINSVWLELEDPETFIINNMTLNEGRQKFGHLSFSQQCC